MPPSDSTRQLAACRSARRRSAALTAGARAVEPAEHTGVSAIVDAIGKIVVQLGIRLPGHRSSIDQEVGAADSCVCRAHSAMQCDAGERDPHSADGHGTHQERSHFGVSVSRRGAVPARVARSMPQRSAPSVQRGARRLRIDARAAPGRWSFRIGTAASHAVRSGRQGDNALVRSGTTQPMLACSHSSNSQPPDSTAQCHLGGVVA